MLFKKSILLFLVVLLSACSSYEVLNIDVLKPAKHTFEPEIKSVVLVDNSIPFRGKDVHQVNTLGTVFSVDTIYVDEFASYSLQSLQAELQARTFFDSVYIHPKNMKSAEKFANQSLSWKEVNALCEKYNAQALIVLETNAYKTKIQVDKIYDYNLYGYLNASGIIFWQAYNNLNQNIIYTETQTDTISWSAMGSNLDEIAHSLPTIKGSLRDLAFYLGAQAADDAAPRWEGQSRGYYSSGNFQFLQASEFVRKQKWGEAIKNWKYTFDHSKKKHKARAAYNLALASEMLDDYESAQYWLQQGMEALGSAASSTANTDKKRLIAYTLYMTKRIKEMKNLKQQIGGLAQ